MASTDDIILSDEDKKVIVDAFLEKEATTKDAFYVYPSIMVSFRHQATKTRYIIYCRRVPHEDRVRFLNIDGSIDFYSVAKPLSNQ